MADLYYDLHIHSCLSPCGDNDMTPNNIVNMSLLKGLDVIAITDHNACDNLPAVLSVAKGTPLWVISGVELATKEEVHVVCLFREYQNCKSFCDFIAQGLKLQNKPEIFGEQRICDEQDEVIGYREELLIDASSISIDKVNELMDKYKGIVIAAHIEKSSTSVLSNLGFFPEGVVFQGKEIFTEENVPRLMQEGHITKGDLLFFNSDAHYLWDISERKHKIDSELLEKLLNKE